MDFLEFSDITAEIKGAMTPGKLKMTDQNIIFKNSRTGRVEQIGASDMEMVNFQNFVQNWGLRIFMKNGILHRFGGFKDSDREKVAKFFSTNYKKDMLEKEISLKGWNWGTAKFKGSVLSFDIGSHSAFEIPLNHVSQCITGKNEITMEYHQNDDAPVSLMEMRFFIPSNELAGDLDPVDAFHEQVIDKASVINVSGDAIAIFREIQCLTPRGRYDIKIFQSFFQLHGKTFDYKIPMSTVLRLFVLPHQDQRQMFFVVSLDPPIKQGQTRYHFLVLLFGQEEETSIELPFTEEELKEKYEGKLTKELSGPTYEVLGKVMKVIISRKITGPGTFTGHNGTTAVSCSFKAAAGYLYPLERGFIYVHKPPIHIRFEEIASVNFARGGGNTRSFDFEIELKSSTVHTFSSIEKEEYGNLFDFISSKKINVKNRGKNDKTSYQDDFGDSDNENEPDAYLARVKAEAKERADDDGDDDDNESTDEDFNPDAQRESDVAEEYDSNHSDTPSEGSGSGGGFGTEKKAKKHKKDKKPRSAKTISEKPRKKRNKDRDDGRPKRPATAFMLWLNETREKIKSESPDMKITEVAKRGGELWKELKDKSEWEGKAAKAKEDYQKAMEEYNANKHADSEKTSDKSEKKSSKSSSKSTASKSKNKPASSPVKPSGAFKSKEYVSDDDSSSNDDDDNKKKKEVKKKDKGVKRKEKDSGDSASDVDKNKKIKSEPKNKSSDEDSDGTKKDSDDDKLNSDDDKKVSKKKTKDTEHDKKVSKKKSKDSDEDKKVTKEKPKDSDDDKKITKKKSKDSGDDKKASKKKSKDSDEESDKSDKKKSKDSPKKSSPSKSKESDVEDEEEKMLSTPPSSDASGDDSD